MQVTLYDGRTQQRRLADIPVGIHAETRGVEFWRFVVTGRTRFNEVCGYWECDTYEPTVPGHFSYVCTTTHADDDRVSGEPTPPRRRSPLLHRHGRA